MARDRNHNLKITNSNKHLLDVFSDDLYLELGSIDYEPLTDLLNKKMVEYDKISHFDIINKGLGSISCDSEELSHKLPFIKLNNIVQKNKSCQLVITYGLLLRRKGYKEHFTPIILIPVRLFYENDTIYFQMMNKPLVNPHIFGEFGKNYETFDKLDSVHSMDKFIMSFLNNHTHNVRYENYMTVMNFNQPEINVRHEKYKVDTSVGGNLIDTYSITCEDDYYNITPLDRNQRTILAMASKGDSFAIAGYEGTGKTTTLINIAADAIKNGKRVLYISNNDSTLETVANVFAENSLQKYVSNLTNSFSMFNEKVPVGKKSIILEQVVKNSLTEPYQKIGSLCELYASKIRNYLLIEIMKELIVTQKPEELFDDKIMKNSYRLYKHEITEVLQALGKIEEEMVKMPSFINSHFINIPITHNIKDYKEPLTLLEKIHDNYCILKETKDILEKNYGFDDITDYALFINKIKQYEKLNKTKVPSSWLKIDYSQNDFKEKFINFKKAKELFTKIKEEIFSYNELKNTIDSMYTEKIKKFDVEKAIELVTQPYFDKDSKEVIPVLKDYQLISNTLHKTIDYCADLETHFAKLKSKLGFTIEFSESNILNQIIDFIYVLDKGYFSKVWCDYDNRDGIYRKMVNIEKSLDKYQDCIKVYQKYFDNLYNLDAYIKMLEKKNKDENSKYKKAPVSELLDCLVFIKEMQDKEGQMKKDYKELTYTEYKYNVHISDVYKEFNEKHDLIENKNSRIQIEKHFQDLRGSGIVDVLTLAKEYKIIEKNIIQNYQFFQQYNLVSSTTTLIDQIKQIRNIQSYVKNVVACQTEMKEILRSNQETILIDDYLLLLNSLNEIKDVTYSITNNGDYKFLYEILFKGEKTIIDDIELYINDFELYLDIFKNPNCLIKSFEPFYNNQIIIHLRNANKTIEDIKDLFKIYVKMFKSNISKLSIGNCHKNCREFFSYHLKIFIFSISQNLIVYIIFKR